MTQPPLSPLQARPLVVGAATALAVACFVVVVAVVARLTADQAVTRPSPTSIQALHDAGVVIDIVGVEEGPDAGPGADIDTAVPTDSSPQTAESAPYDPSAVAAAAAVVVQRCAREALRWDPSLGGAFTLHVRLPAATSIDAAAQRDERKNDARVNGTATTPRSSSSSSSLVVIETPGLISPVLEACVQRQAAFMESVVGTDQLLVPQAVVARAVLQTAGTVAVADADIVALPPSAAARGP